MSYIKTAILAAILISPMAMSSGHTDKITRDCTSEVKKHLIKRNQWIRGDDNIKFYSTYEPFNQGTKYEGEWIYSENSSFVTNSGVKVGVSYECQYDKGAAIGGVNMSWVMINGNMVY